MSQALTDRTGYTCLYAVYSTTAHACGSLLFSLCGIQISATSEFASLLRRRGIPAESQNVPVTCPLASIVFFVNF